MTNTCTGRDAAAHDVAARLIGFEAHLEESIALAGELMTGLSRARSEAGLAVGYGQSAFAQAPAIIASLIEARGAAAEMHRTLGAVGRKLGVKMGPPGDKDDGDFLPQPMAQLPTLRAVG